MALQVAQYVDLRTSIDSNPPSYDYLNSYGSNSGESRMLDIESRQTEAEEDRQESRPSTKSSKGTASKVTVRPTPPAKTTPKLTPKPEPKVPPQKPAKETSDTAVQDEGGDPISAHVERSPNKRTRSTLQTVKETDQTNDQFEDAFELTDENFWALVPVDQVPGRFSQYRTLTAQKLKEMEEQLSITLAKTQRKVNTLKSQFQEHKGKWEAERRVLIDQVEQAQKLQTEAEKEADVAMTQLEEFINEQERLEEEEEVKRQEVVKGVSKPVVIPVTTETQDESTSTMKTSTSPQTEPAIPDIKPTPAGDATGPNIDTPDGAPPSPVKPEPAENELNNLLQQTDDAKVKELNSRITSGAMSAPPVVDPDSRSASVQEIKEKTHINGRTEEEIRVSSSMSRASLRNQYRNKLEEVRQAVEERRAKSPAISIPSQRSLDEDQLIDEDDDDEAAVTDEIKELKKDWSEIGTSPRPDVKKELSSKSFHVQSDHKLVGEFLKTYDGIIQFKEALSKLMIDREMLQQGQIINDLDTISFDKGANVEPQLEYMTRNVYQVLQEIMMVLGSILLADREPMVSSLNGHLISREPTQFPQRDRSAESGRGPNTTRASHYSAKSSASDKNAAVRELQENYDRIQQRLTDQSMKHEEQLRHNTVVMMEMQDTINELQRELSNLGRSSSRLRPHSEGTSPHGTTDSSIMFTRLDSERNAKIMKRAVNENKMGTDTYKDAVDKMGDYVSLPAQRLAHLVRKYVHHSRMKEIEENVKKSKSLNENVFEILDKMEALQNQRAKKWADRMDEMGAERLRLANLLMETLECIEQESGIFLIKPMYSYRGRDIKDRYGGKLARPVRQQRHISPKREIQSTVSAYAPAPTPASNVRGIANRGHGVSVSQPGPMEQNFVFPSSSGPVEGDEQGLMGNSINWVGAAPRQTWSMNASLVRGDQESFINQNPNLMNTPRILELDINRMMIGQNNISSKILQAGLTDDRLVNASQNNLRSYVTVNRPTVNQSQTNQARPVSYSSSTNKDQAPPSSPASHNPKRVRMSDTDLLVSRNMTNTPPLPPIRTDTPPLPQIRTDSQLSLREALAEPPQSPPGSSMRQSPPHTQEMISPLK